jgi:hypothetical protein
MSEVDTSAVPKIHPASREMLPDDPLEMQAFEVAGDPELMLRILVEEYARIGWGLEAIVRLARDPNYTAFYGLLQALGEESLRQRVSNVLARCGVMRVKARETEPLSERLVQIRLAGVGEK